MYIMHSHILNPKLSPMVPPILKYISVDYLSIYINLLQLPPMLPPILYIIYNVTSNHKSFPINGIQLNAHSNSNKLINTISWISK